MYMNIIKHVFCIYYYWNKYVIIYISIFFFNNNNKTDFLDKYLNISYLINMLFVIGVLKIICIQNSSNASLLQIINSNWSESI